MGLSPANTTRGMRACAAVARAVMICVRPGPQVTEATPTCARRHGIGRRHGAGTVLVADMDGAHGLILRHRPPPSACCRRRSARTACRCPRRQRPRREPRRWAWTASGPPGGEHRTPANPCAVSRPAGPVLVNTSTPPRRAGPTHPVEGSPRVGHAGRLQGLRQHSRAHSGARQRQGRDWPHLTETDKPGRCTVAGPALGGGQALQQCGSGFRWTTLPSGTAGPGSRTADERGRVR